MDMKISRGFTLVELIVVMALIAILAAIAIAQYRNFQLRAKTSEAKTNLGALRRCELSYAAERDTLLTAAYYPGKAGPSKQVWNQASSGNFDKLGFDPAGKVYYDYGIAQGDHTSDPASATPSNDEIPNTNGVIDITIIARGDLDGNAQYAYYCTCEERRSIIGPKGDRF